MTDRNSQDSMEEGRRVDYGAIKTVSENVVLSDIQTMNFGADSTRSLAGMLAGEFAHRISVRGKLSVLEDNFGVVFVEFDYQAKRLDKNLATVNGALAVFYEMVPEHAWDDFDPDLVQEFGEVNGIYNTWSYIREIIASSLTRLGLSGVLLPLWRPPAVLPPAGEYAILEYEAKDEVANPSVDDGGDEEESTGG